jgi:hypothetical protein
MRDPILCASAACFHLEPRNGSNASQDDDAAESQFRLTLRHVWHAGSRLCVHFFAIECNYIEPYITQERCPCRLSRMVSWPSNLSSKYVFCAPLCSMPHSFHAHNPSRHDYVSLDDVVSSWGEPFAYRAQNCLLMSTRFRGTSRHGFQRENRQQTQLGGFRPMRQHSQQTSPGTALKN